MPKHSEQIHIRLTPGQLHRIRRAAELEGMPLSTWLRWVGLRRADIALPRPPVDQEENE